MNSPPLHAVPWEHAPAGAPAALLSSALALAVAGVAALPHARTAPRPAPVRSPAPPAVVVAPAPPAVVVTPAQPAPEPPRAVAPPPGADCPPRWSVRFAYGSAAAPAGVAARAGALRDYLASHPQTSLTVVGFADASGNDLANETLSLRRAAAVTRALARGGVPWERVTTRGLGALGAIVDDGAEAAALRRVAVRVRGARPCAGAPEEVIEP